jgi:hypothetical protein
MRSFKFGESKFGIKVPEGWYPVRFVGIEDREPFPEKGKFGGGGEPRIAWVFEVTDGEHKGQRIEQESGCVASPKSTCARMLLKLSGRAIRAGEDVTVEPFLNRRYRLKVAVNPDSDKGNLHVADLEAAAPPPPPKPPKPAPNPQDGAAPLPPPDRRYFVAKDGETPVLTDTADIQSYLISSRIKPEELLLCPEGDTVYKSADQFGFTIPF